MSKTKFVLGMSMVVALFAFTATPALAQWTNHGGKGAGHSGEGTLTYEGGTVNCAGAAGSYKINSEGTDLQLEGITWKECKSLGQPAEVKCAMLEMKQPNKEGTEKGKAVGSQVSSECMVNVAKGVCIINIPTEGNKELKTISMKKSGLNVALDVEVTGVTATAKGGGCALGGITKEKTTSATEKVPGLVSEGVGLE